MAESTIWWVLAGVFVAVEMLTGTFYLLMLSAGLFAGALAAHAGAAIPVQLGVAAAVGGIAVLGWRAYKKTIPITPANSNSDVNLDIGETVLVDAWKEDGTSTVKYRGANWSVSLIDSTPPSAGLHTVVEVVGSRLIVKKKI